MKGHDLRKLRAASRRFAIVAMVLMGLLLLFVGAMLVEESGQPAARAKSFSVRILYLLPAIFYLWALFALHRMFRNIGAGGTFEPAISSGLRQLGWALLGSGVANAFVVPLIAITMLRTRLEPGPISPGGYQGRIDVAYVVLALVGVAIILLARLFGIAAKHQARKNELEAELSEFL